MLRYSAQDFLRAALTCLCCHKTEKLQRNRKNSAQRKELYLRRGEQKLKEDLDVVNWLEQVKMVRMVMKVLFNKNQSMFLKYQRRDTLCSSNESNQEEDKKQHDLVEQIAMLDVDNENRSKAISQL